MVKKLFAQLDDDFPGVRVNALDALRDHLKKANQSFRGLLHQIEGAVPRADYEKALKDIQQQRTSITQLTQELTKKTREAATYRQALAIKLNWPPIAVLAGAAVALWFVVGWIIRPSFPENGESDLRHLAQRLDWNGPWFDRPFVAQVNGEPYWLLLRSTVDELSFVDRTNNPIIMRCLHVFAGSAEADSGQYLKPQPYRLFGFGWLSWPERLVDCRPAPNQKIAGQ